MKNEKLRNKPAYNGRFGTMAAVSPQTILCKLARYYPAASSVEAATAPSRWNVIGNSAKTVGKIQRTNLLGGFENKIG